MVTRPDQGLASRGLIQVNPFYEHSSVEGEKAKKRAEKTRSVHFSLFKPHLTLPHPLLLSTFNRKTTTDHGEMCTGLENATN